jgi:flagellar motor switch protein FliG
MKATGDELTELLALLGADVAEAVRPHLSSESASVIATLRAGDARGLSPRRRQRLLGEFERFVHYAVSQSTTAGAPAAPPVEDFRSAEGDSPEAVLEKSSTTRFVQGIRGEHPRVVAVALDSLPPLRVAELLAALPNEIRPEVVLELSKGVKLNADVRRRVLAALAKKIVEQPDHAPPDVDHVKKLAEIIRATDKTVRRPLLESLQEQDPDAAAQLSDLLYRFDDILDLDDRAVQQILGQIDVNTLAAALSGAEEAISEKILKNLSRRASDMLKEELQFSGRTPASKIENARMAVTKLIAKTEQEAE